MLISAIIVAACRTTRTITASSEGELPLLLVVSRGVEFISVYRIQAIDASAFYNLPSTLVGNCVVTCMLVDSVDSVLVLEQSLYRSS